MQRSTYVHRTKEWGYGDSVCSGQAGPQALRRHNRAWAKDMTR